MGTPEQFSFVLKIVSPAQSPESSMGVYHPVYPRPKFIFLGSKITVDSDHSHEIKRHLLLGRKTVINLESILKSRDITLLT